MDHKNLQVRKTREDVKVAQKKMREIVKSKIKNNDILHDEEYENWMDLCADALMSWGKNVKVNIDTATATIHLGSVHTFALRFMDWDTSLIFVNYKNKKYSIKIKQLWKYLYDYMLQVFPLSLDEALHISKEADERQHSSSYSFSADKKLGER